MGGPLEDDLRELYNTLAEIFFLSKLESYLCLQNQVEIHEINTEPAQARAEDRLRCVLWEHVFIPHLFRVCGV